MQLTYLGTNSLMIKKGDSTLLVDPHFTRPNLFILLMKIKPDQERVAEGLAASRIAKLDGVLLTHTHYDHAMDAPEVIKQIGGTLYGSVSAGNLAETSGLSQTQYQVVTPGDLYAVGDFQVRFHAAHHLPWPRSFSWFMPEKELIDQAFSPHTWFWNYYSGQVLAVQVDQVLIFGSAGFEPGICHDLEVETVVLSIGGLALKPHTYLERLYDDVVCGTGAKRVLISHWDKFFRPAKSRLSYLGLTKRTIKRIINLGKRYGQKITVLSFMDELTL